MISQKNKVFYKSQAIFSVSPNQIAPRTVWLESAVFPISCISFKASYFPQFIQGIEKEVSRLQFNIYPFLLI